MPPFFKKVNNMDLINKAKEIEPHLIELRKEFHKHPEIATKEFETAKMIKKELDAIGGYDIKEKVDGTNGILAEIKGDKPGKTICLRADFDALSIKEETNCDFKSENEGYMHACGHDMHTTMLLGAARIIKENKNELKGTVRLIFQPQEEFTPDGGSRHMIKGGALKDADAVFGMHVWPNYKVGKFGFKVGALMAASDHIYAHIDGKACHGATPNEGVDAVVCGCALVQSWQTIVSRNVSPMEPAVVTVGKFNTISNYNITPGVVDIEGTCRSYNPDVRDTCERRLKEIFDNTLKAYGCTGTFKYQRGYCPLVNEEKSTLYYKKVVEELFGKESIYDIPTPTTTAEDFGFYINEIGKGSFMWAGCTEEGQDVWPLHNSHMLPSEKTLVKGVAIYAALVFSQDDL